MATSEKPVLSCDIVMKGGITSGVVYPLALVALAEKYRFANIGGTSAGAIAAAAAAAAEYGRPVKGAGFDRLAKIPQEVGTNLLSMFQPAATLKPLFGIFVAALKAKSPIGQVVAIATAAIAGYWRSATLGALPGIVIALIAGWHAAAGFALFGALLALIGLIAALAIRLLRAATVELAATDFGVCPGIRQSPSAPEGFTDWLAMLIEEAAGHQDAGRPLTFGDLSAPPEGAPQIHLAMMTTSLMEGRPYALPMENKRFFFKKDEWLRIFPEGVVTYLVSVCERFAGAEGETGEFYAFPDPDDLPLIVGARMSLSFPFLISAVPLWTRDFTLSDDAERKKLRRCLFSDGGLSSNFPIHFFDRLLPNSPTFAISLDDYEPLRNYSNVWLPSSSGSGSQLPLQPLVGLAGFLGRILYSAKDWQDNLQSTLPGYRERIVHVVLKPDQGGLNLTMSPATIQALVDYGEEAGRKLRDDFDLAGHRWRRFLVSMARIEETLDEVAAAYEQIPGQFGAFLDDYVRDHAPYLSPQSGKPHPPYSQDTEERVKTMLARAAALVELGQSWRTAPTIRNDRIPKPATLMRINPKD